jgi:flagellar hook capping protein FlgD
MKLKFVSLFFALFILHFLCIISHSSIIYAVDVSGHISEDTIWSPDNNPFIVVDNIWVDPNVTLTILPGTIVKFETSTYPTGDYFYGDGYSEAKFLQVSGRIIAVGTAQDSIVFTKNCDDTDRRWGVIILDYLSADDSIFDHCRIEYSFRMQLFVGGDTYSGAVTLSSARATIRNCYFKNYHSAIHGFYDSSPWIYKNYFICNDENAQNYTWSAIRFHDNIGTKPYISYNTFEDCQGIDLLDVNTSFYSAITYNIFINCSEGIDYTSPGIVYKNEFINGSTAIRTDDYEVIIQQNVIDSCFTGINADYKYSIINNIISNGSLGLYLRSSNTNESNIIFNNVIVNNLLWAIRNSYSNSIIFNNIISNSEEGISTSGGYDYTPHILNNVISLCEVGLEISSSCEVFNNIIYDIEDFSIDTSGNSSTINSGNNCFSAPLQTVNVTYNDLGGNITDDPLFIDPINGDYHLSGSSPCIDAGTEDTTPFDLPVFDLDLNERIWDGNNNGIPIIDMGCYEFDSHPAMGGIEGIISLNYINNFLPFTEIDVDGTIAFPDTTGYYELRLLPGNYELTAYLDGYEGVYIPNIEVDAGVFTQLDFEMISLVSVEEYEVPTNDFLSSNFPNPFNPTTTIMFSIPEESKIGLFIYNIKGQRVKTILNDEFERGIHDVVWDSEDNSGKLVSSGVYFYKFEVNGEAKALKKMLLLK